MIRFALVCALALCFSATAVFAQMPGNMGSGDMTITKYGLFVLKGGVLAKFDAATLKQQGAALELFGPMLKAPTPGVVSTTQDHSTLMTWSIASGIRRCPAAMLAKDDELLIVMYNSVFRVNQQTMTLDTTQAKLLVDDPQNPNMSSPWMVMNLGKPVLLLNEKVLYILLGTNLVAVNSDTADVLINGALPKEMAPKTPAMPPRHPNPNTAPPAPNNPPTAPPTAGPNP